MSSKPNQHTSKMNHSSTCGNQASVLQRVTRKVKIHEFDLEAEVQSAMQTLRVRDAADAVAGAYGLPRRDIYQIALKIQRRNKIN